MNRIGTVYDRAGSHWKSIAQRESDGGGLNILRMCDYCRKPRDVAGGKRQPGGLYKCAHCRAEGTK